MLRPWHLHALAALVCLLFVLGLSGCGGGDTVQVVAAAETRPPVVIAGAGAPGDSVGNDGDYYLDTAASLLYGPKAGGAWPPLGVSLTGPAGPPGPAGPSGATGPAGGAPFDMAWRIDPNTVFGDGTYYLIVGGINATLRLPVLLPRDCAQAGLRVATLGTPGAGQRYRFQVLHTPGPSLSALVAETRPEWACGIDDLDRSCASAWTMSPAWQAGDAVEVQMVGTQALSAMADPGAIAVSFTCQ
ncbi:hypothetical protein [Hydrogenophaga sp. T2]|uniref:hypothetical protein n=1 Tax=Hydrogenophaga sp. T2 TaxID=3132823 RepID=UPI003CF626CC